MEKRRNSDFHSFLYLDKEGSKPFLIKNYIHLFVNTCEILCPSDSAFVMKDGNFMNTIFSTNETCSPLHVDDNVIVAIPEKNNIVPRASLGG